MSIDVLFAMVQRALAGQYSLEREIGRGGMGVVYLAREVELARLVALKVLPPELAADRATRDRFLREARTAAGLSHPHIVPIHRVAEAADFVYFSMMFVDGETLGERLRTRGPLSVSAATRVLREVSQALAYAHGHGIIHRDIKPDNILLERESGRALVTDFGIAGAADAGAAHDDPVMGTIHYMSPEQAAGEPLDGRSDLYSLGVVAHVALSGRLPSSVTPALGEAALPEQRSLAVAAPAIPRYLVAAIDRALASDPGARFPTLEAFSNAVDRPEILRQALPEPVRAMLEARDPWRAPSLIWSGGWLTALALDTNDPSFAVIAALMSLAPAIPTSVFEIRTARRLHDAGYSFGDVRRAVPAWEAERRAAMDAEDSGHRPFVAAAARTAAWTAVAMLVSTFTPFKGMVIELMRFGGDATLGALVFTGGAALPLLSAAGIPVLPRMLRSPRSLRERIWNSTLGRRVGDALLRRQRTMPPPNAFRPTELALGSAITALWRALPPAWMDDLEGLPKVVSRLESHATHARGVLVDLEASAASTMDSRELAPVRDRARHELESAVSALESLRLGLLRLLGGDTDVRPMTTALHAAADVSDRLARISDAQRDVELALRPLGLDLRPHTPV